MHTIYLSGGGERSKFGGYKNKTEVKTFLQTEFGDKVSFPTSGKVDIILIPNEVKAPSDSAMKKYATANTQIFQLQEFVAWKAKSLGKKSSGKKTKKSSGKKSSGKKTSAKKSSGKKTKKSSGKKPKKLTREQILWNLVTSLQWSSDHDIDRVKNQLATWPLPIYDEVEMFVHDKVETLMQRFRARKTDWNLLSEIVSLGPEMYHSITKTKLDSMNPKKYIYNFEFCFERE
jgi:hypothetical protein